MDYNLVTILGPTAAGKTRLASLLASEFNGEIISADSRQVYRNMNIGTGKDYEDYMINNSQLKYHLIDIIDPSEEYNVYRFKEDFVETYKKIVSQNRLPFLCGGTGLYLSAILQNYMLSKSDLEPGDEMALLNYSNEELKFLLLQQKIKLHNISDLTERERLIKAIIVARSSGKIYADTSFIKSFNIGIYPGRVIVKKRITERLKTRLKNGMIEEVESLIGSGITKERLLLFGLEYRFITLYLTGELNYNDMYQKLESAIHNFAKRQMTWFRKMEKEGIRIHWFNSPEFQPVVNLIKETFFA